MGYGNRYQWVDGKNVNTQIRVDWLERRTKALSLISSRIKKQSVNLDWNSYIIKRKSWIWAIYTYKLIAEIYFWIENYIGFIFIKKSSLIVAWFREHTLLNLQRVKRWIWSWEFSFKMRQLRWNSYMYNIKRNKANIRRIYWRSMDITILMPVEIRYRQKFSVYNKRRQSNCKAALHE